MSESDHPQSANGAVFVSYAREDKMAAQRIAEGLRTFGVEVWFDQNELRGGDAWERKIRTQIKTCALFLPIVSRQTEARSEGYFRREWRLAVDRTQDMGDSRAFIVPVVIDDTRETGAEVPEEFLRYQWTRLPDGGPTPEFVLQVQRLLEPPKRAAGGPGDPMGAKGGSVASSDGTQAARRVTNAVPGPIPVLTSLRRQWTTLTTLVAVLAGLGLVAVLWRGGPSTGESGPAPSEARFSLPPPDGYAYSALSPSLSHDGRRLAFAAEKEGRRQVFLRDMASMQVTPVAGTEGVSALRISPDGTWLVFREGSRLLRLQLSGQQVPVAVPSAPSLALGGAAAFDIADDGSIMLVADLAAGLLQIGVKGEAQLIRPLDRAAGELGLMYPRAFDGGRTVLFGLLTKKGWKLQGRWVATGREVTVLEGAPIAEFFPRNLLIYSQEGGLFARQFDPRALSVSGAATTLDSKLPNEQLAMSQAVYFTVSQTGVLVHLAGPPSPELGLLAVVDRKSGQETPLRSTGARPRFVPSGGDKVVSEESAQIWLTDLSSGARTRVTDGEILHYVAVPTRDGGRLYASSYQDGPAQLVSHSLSMVGAPQQVTRGHSRRRYAASFAPDGRLAMVELGETTQTDILLLQPDGTEREWLKTRYDERHPRFSPDGRWLAYTSDESGRSEVYLKPADSAVRAINLSIDGGEAPVWDPGGRELLFLRGEEIFAVTIEQGATVTTGRPRAVLRVPGIAAPDAVSVPYDLSPDGQRVVFAKRSERTPAEMRVVLGVRPPR